jgi:tetrahydromethanopterin S-methyltransferase subunit E
VKKGLRLWFYPEAILGLITGVLFVVTLFSREWIELVFRVDPDQGSGALEWAVVIGLAVVTVVMAFLARYEWRRASSVVAA